MICYYLHNKRREHRVVPKCRVCKHTVSAPPCASHLRISVWEQQQQRKKMVSQYCCEAHAGIPLWRKDTTIPSTGWKGWQIGQKNGQQPPKCWFLNHCSRWDRSMCRACQEVINSYSFGSNPFLRKKGKAFYSPPKYNEIKSYYAIKRNFSAVWYTALARCTGFVWSVYIRFVT